MFAVTPLSILNIKLGLIRGNVLQPSVLNISDYYFVRQKITRVFVLVLYSSMDAYRCEIQYLDEIVEPITQDECNRDKRLQGITSQ